MLSPADTVVVRQVLDGLRQGIEAMTPAAKHVYTLAIRQVMVESFIGLFVALVLWIPIALLWRSVPPADKRNYYDSDNLVGITIGTVLVGVINIILFIMYVPGLLNPEWVAIQKLMCVLR